MKISPDQYLIAEWGWGRLNATILFTWVIMILLAGGSWCICRKLSDGAKMTRWQNLLEVIVSSMAEHIEDITHRNPHPFLPFVGTLFLFILLSNVLSVVPYFMPPTGSLSTTTAFALLVFAAVPSFGLSTRSLGNYLSEYIKPTPFMLPFNILGEITRTFALAVRLYGNVMSGTVIGIVLLIVMPIFFPVIMQALGLLTGVIQAYIFALLAMVYIASALQKKDDQNLTN
jgi:F-type H+-transporting ATPase subunit a